MKSFATLLLVAIIAAVPAVGYTQTANKAAHDHKHDHKQDKKETAKEEEHDHHHEAPHGGTLVLLGDHFAMLELVVDQEEGTMTGYVLDGEAEKAVRIQLPHIEIQMSTDAGKTTDSVKLMPVASPLTGEKVGDTSEFSAKHSKFKNLKKFDGVVSSIKIKGEKFVDTEFKFPEGNE